MADQWFVMRDDKKYGPYPSAQLEQMASTGGVLPFDMVQADGGKWMPASQIKGLFPAAPPKSVPPPGPPPLPDEGPPPLPDSGDDQGVVVLSKNASTRRPQANGSPMGLLPPFIGMTVILAIALLTGLWVILALLNDDLKEETRHGVKYGFSLPPFGRLRTTWERPGRTLPSIPTRFLPPTTRSSAPGGFHANAGVLAGAGSHPVITRRDAFHNARLNLAVSGTHTARGY